MSEWWREPMLAFDLETTGVDPEAARIVSAAVVIVNDGPVRVRSWLADPGVEIPAGASAVHGITTQRAQAEGRPAAEVVREVADTIARGWEGGPLPLVVYNARYDLTVLDRECRRHGIGPLPLVHGPVIDPLIIDRWLDPFRRGSRKLEAVCAHYGASLNGAHDAGADALAAARLAWCLGARGEVMWQARSAQERRELEALRSVWKTVRDDFHLLHGAQCEWASADALRLAQYFRSVGRHEDADGVRPEWPLVPA